MFRETHGRYEIGRRRGLDKPRSHHLNFPRLFQHWHVRVRMFQQSAATPDKQTEETSWGSSELYPRRRPQNC